MKKLLIYLIFISYFNIFSSCEKSIPNEYIDFRFEVPLSVTPNIDTLNLGDTLTLEAKFSDSMKEVHSGKYYKLENFDFQTRIGFFKLGNSSLFMAEQGGIAGSYKIISLTGSISNLSQSFGKVNFDYSNHTYNLKVQLIPSQKGVATISFLSNYIGKTTQLNFIDLGTNSEGGKKIANLRNIWYIVNNGNTHFNLFKQNSKLGNLNNIDENNYETLATYTFVVK